MIRELRKIGDSTRLCLLLFLAVCCNAVLFTLHATGDSAGYTMSQLRDAFRQEDLSGYDADLWQRLEQMLDGSTLTEYNALRRQLSAADAALNRVQQAENYAAFRSGLSAEARLKLRMGLFDGFSARSLQRGIEVYDSLADVTPQPVFLGGAELLLSFPLTDALALLFPLAAGLTLLVHERASGLLALTRPTRYGRSRTYCRKLAAAAALSTLGFALLYGVNTLLAGVLYGLSDLNVPVQSLYGFAACPYRLTAGQLLLLSAGLKYLWLLCCTALVFLLCSGTGKAAVAVACTAAGGGLAALMASSSRLWLRNLSLWQLADPQSLCREAVYLDLLGHPADRILCGVGFLFLTALAAWAGGAVLYARTPAGSRRAPLMQALPRPRHTCLAGHELYKALLSQQGLCILLAFLAGITLLYSRVAPERSEFEAYYRNYSTILAGAPDKEKDVYLEGEQTRLDNLDQQLLELMRRYPDSALQERETGPIREQLRVRDAFQLAQSQYRQLQPGQVYLYQSGYQRLLGPDARRQNVLELGAAFLTLALLLSGSFAGERACGMESLLTASLRRRDVLRWKIILAGLYTLVLTLALWLPPLWAVQRAYGSLELTAQANSVQCLSTLADNWSLGGVLLLLLLGRLFLLLAVSAVVMFLSRRCTVVQTLLLSLLLLLPIGAAYAFM